jgi:uncharacterized membrane protein YbhN (UPF0104 family)
MTTQAERTAPEAGPNPSTTDADPDLPAPDEPAHPAHRWWVWLRRLALVALVGAAGWFLARRGTELRGAANLLSRLDWRLVALAVLFEAASMVVFARLQRWLLRAGHVTLPMGTMVEITLAGNAIAATLPGGVAWAAAWAFGQLRRRGVDRFLRVWVFLVAGAVSSFALFLVVVAGIEVAGNRGPVAGLRWAAVALAAIPVVGLGAVLIGRRLPVARAGTWLGAGIRRRVPGGRSILRGLGTVIDRLNAVHLSPLRWAEVLGLAVLNWLYDCAVLVCALLALHVGVPWRGIFVIYGITQIAAALPITPGGLGVVEGSLAGLLTAYGVPTEAALATVLVYRIVSFWGLVPVGWGVWVWLDVMQRRGGGTRRSHPWAFHVPHPRSEKIALLPDPEPCRGCDGEAEPSPWSSTEAS